MCVNSIGFNLFIGQLFLNSVFGMNPDKCCAPLFLWIFHIASLSVIFIFLSFKVGPVLVSFSIALSLLTFILNNKHPFDTILPLYGDVNMEISQENLRNCK